MIIEDIYGGTLSLTDTRLTEITRYTHDPYYVNLSHLLPNSKRAYDVRVRCSKYPTSPVSVSVDPDAQTIGCRMFSKKVFKVIMSAARKRLKEVNG